MKQIKDMTTAEWRKAWTEIAVAFETEPGERTDWQWGLVYEGGLCAAFDTFVFGTAYQNGVSNYLDRFAECSGFWFPRGPFIGEISETLHKGEYGWTRQHDLLRATFAAMFAAMTPKEFLAICEAPR